MLLSLITFAITKQIHSLRTKRVDSNFDCGEIHKEILFKEGI
jgi:hypothetical protein